MELAQDWYHMALGCENVVLLLQGSLTHGGRGIGSHVLQRRRRCSAVIQAKYVCRALRVQVSWLLRQLMLVPDNVHHANHRCAALLQYCDSQVMTKQNTR